MRRSLLLLLLGAACSKSGSKPPATTAVLASTEHYKVELAACATAPCEPTLVLTALGDYKVNADYPHKWVPDPASAEAAPGPGTFAHPSKNIGTLAVPVRAGTTHVSGTFKLAVCTDAECKLEAPTIAFDVR
jgi:hypothetical protein